MRKIKTLLIEQIKKDKVSFIVYLILRILVIATIIRCIFEQRWESAFVGLLALVLFFLPTIVEKTFRVSLPTTLETLALIFVFCAEILGEIEEFYVKYTFWDTMLHTANGFIFAAFGFCLVDVLNRSTKIKFELSPIYTAITAFCFSMTIGVFWEFFEYLMDHIFLLDMQKDAIISQFGSVLLNDIPSNTVVNITDISKTIIETSNGTYIVNGYLDIGLNDTIKDLFVNFIGAMIFCFFGFFYVKSRGKGKIANQFIPVLDESVFLNEDDTK